MCEWLAFPCFVVLFLIQDFLSTFCQNLSHYPSNFIHDPRLKFEVTQINKIRWNTWGNYLPLFLPSPLLPFFLPSFLLLSFHFFFFWHLKGILDCNLYHPQVKLKSPNQAPDRLPQTYVTIPCSFLFLFKIFY